MLLIALVIHNWQLRPLIHIRADICIEGALITLGEPAPTILHTGKLHLCVLALYHCVF
jgi:hypothetical protein